MELVAHTRGGSACTPLPYATVYIARGVVYRTPGAYHPGYDIVLIPEQPPDVSPGYVACHTPCGIVTQNRNDTPKTSAPATCRTADNILLPFFVVKVKLARRLRLARLYT